MTMVTIAKLQQEIAKAGGTELTKILAKLEAISNEMDQLASTGALAPGITHELEMLSNHVRARSKSIQLIKEKTQC